MVAITDDYLHCVIVSPDEVLYEADVVKVMVPGLSQDLAILPHHTPLYAQLKDGDISVTDRNDTVQAITIEGGIIRVKNNSVSILIGFDTRETLFKA